MMRIDKRCFGLLAGPNEDVAGIKLVLTINAFDDPSIKQQLKVNFTMEEFLLEYCNEIFQNVYNVLMEYKSLFWMSSLYPAPTKRTLQR